MVPLTYGFSFSVDFVLQIYSFKIIMRWVQQRFGDLKLGHQPGEQITKKSATGYPELAKVASPSSIGFDVDFRFCSVPRFSSSDTCKLAHLRRRFGRKEMPDDNSTRGPIQEVGRYFDVHPSRNLPSMRPYKLSEWLPIDRSLSSSFWLLISDNLT